jgi:thymidylate synthase
MRFYQNPLEAVREVERDLFEMGINVHPQTMQDKDVANNPDFMTKEIRHYGFQINNAIHTNADELAVVKYVMGEEYLAVLNYIEQEHDDRTCGEAMNPGNAYKHRLDVWTQFLHNGKFHYTYSERIAPQLKPIMHELKARPDTRQAIITIHSNICPVQGESDNDTTNFVAPSRDLENMGGHGRIPCSLHYEFMRREGRLEMEYHMRSCDFLTHFPVDLMLALRMQKYVADFLGVPCGDFTYFTSSMHAYAKDMKKRGIF